MNRKSHLTLLSTTAIGLAFAAGIAQPRFEHFPRVELNRAWAQNPCAPKANPCAAANPCASKKNPCNPCGAAAAASFSAKCVVPRLVSVSAANPCAAKAPCGARANPCAAKAGAQGARANPGAAKAAVNPCGVKANPCAAKANPCSASAKNPCAAKANPCSAKANPCAAKNPCAASANPCNPCDAAQVVELQDREAAQAYDCMLREMLAAYAKSGHPTAVSYIKWRRYSTQSYQSATHGARFVQNYANDQAKAYGNFESAGTLPLGAQLAKDSFLASPSGQLGVGPLFMMEKMAAGFNPTSGDWKYTMIMADGTIFGETKGTNSAGMQFCAECHANSADKDHLMFMPVEYRAKR